jgi:hypothetical protein
LTPFVESTDEDAMARSILVMEEGTWCMTVELRDHALEPKSHIIPSHGQYIGDGSRLGSEVYKANLFTPREK